LSLVGIIANPAAGKDIRRLVAHGRVVPIAEKVSVLRRVLLALDAAGVERVVIMPDPSRIGRQAVEETDLKLSVDILEMLVSSEENDSTRAATMMSEMDVDCLVTLGGDGTNRVVAKGSGRVPIVPISTGTNNVFPQMVEGTTAGLAAAVVARGLVDLQEVCSTYKRLEVRVDGAVEDMALIDLAVSREQFVGARAIWDIETIEELFLTCADPASIGLSSIGAQLHALSRAEPEALYLRLGENGTTVLAPIAPGMVRPVRIAEWRLLTPGEPVEITRKPSVIALDGERQFAALPDQRVEVSLSADGPRVVAIDAALSEAARLGVFTGASWADGEQAAT